jgi:CBS domain-containing protein
MQVRELMSETVICATPQMSLQDAARLMKDRDIGSLPVVKNSSNKKLIGMITDRDIVCRALAEGRNPMDMTVQDVMSSGSVYKLHADSSEAELCQVMEERQVRRIPVVDDNDLCIGIVSQADIARMAPESETGEVVQQISQPGRTAW